MSTPHNFNDSSSDPFTEWFIAERATELEDDVDDVDEDDYGDNSWGV